MNLCFNKLGKNNVKLINDKMKSKYPKLSSIFGFLN